MDWVDLVDWVDWIDWVEVGVWWLWSWGVGEDFGVCGGVEVPAFEGGGRGRGEAYAGRISSTTIRIPDPDRFRSDRYSMPMKIFCDTDALILTPTRALERLIRGGVAVLPDQAGASRCFSARITCYSTAWTGSGAYAALVTFS